MEGIVWAVDTVMMCNGSKPFSLSHPNTHTYTLWKVWWDFECVRPAPVEVGKFRCQCYICTVRERYPLSAKALGSEHVPIQCATFPKPIWDTHYCHVRIRDWNGKVQRQYNHLMQHASVSVCFCACRCVCVCVCGARHDRSIVLGNEIIDRPDRTVQLVPCHFLLF